MKLIACIALLAGTVSAQILTPDPNYSGHTETIISREMVDGKMVLKLKSYEPCFSAVYPPCPGHTRYWSEIYSVSNGTIVVERKDASYTPAQTIPEKVDWSPTNSPAASFWGNYTNNVIFFGTNTNLSIFTNAHYSDSLWK